MQRRESKETSGPGSTESDPGRVAEERKEAALKELSFVLFQVALARRRVQDIMEAQDLAMVIYYRELDFVHTVLSDVHRLLRSVAYGPNGEA